MIYNYQELAELIHTEQTQLLKRTRELAWAAGGQVEQIQTEWIVETFEVIAGCLRSGTLEKWYELVLRQVQEVIDQQLSMQTTLAAGEGMFGALHELIDQHYPDPQQARLHERFKKRITVIRLVGDHTVRNSYVFTNLDGPLEEPTAATATATTTAASGPILTTLRGQNAS